MSILDAPARARKKILAITLNPAIDKVYAIDDFEIGGVFRPRDMTATAGGKGLNVARVTHLLEEPVVATGFIGGGNGQFIQNKVRESKIAAEFVPIEGESRICINVTDTQKSLCTEILEPGPAVSFEESQQFLEHYRRLLQDSSLVTASGSLPLGISVDFYRQLIEIAAQYNIRFILDTSGSPLEQGIQSEPFMIKPNLEEARKLLRLDLATLKEQAEAVLKLKQRGIPIPCITLGKDGCLAGLDDGVYHFYGKPVEVVNSVGSGDSFVAGCAVGLVRNFKPVDVIKLGMAAGMANTQFFQTGMISLELVNRFYEQIQFEIIIGV
ncbi:MAG TPA: 1-phosphofructokinase family hexose kinase [Bacillota bacterium]|nr:1-phosphofructokinase family hexose kinase [Bacillota bacterium]